MSEHPKFVMVRRLQKEGRYEDFLARMEVLKARGDLPSSRVWLYAAREFNPVDGSPHEIGDLPREPLAMLIGELDGSEYVDDAPPPPKYEPTPDPLAEGFSVDESETEAAWERLVEKHMLPSRLMAIGVGLEEPTDEEKSHIAECKSCKKAFNAYRKPPAKSSSKPRVAKPVRPVDPVDDPVAEDYSDVPKLPRDAFENEVFTRLHKKVEKSKKAKPFDEIEWVASNLDEPPEDIHPKDIPSRAALSMLRTARTSAAARASFMDKHWAKIVPSKAELANQGNSADKHATQHRLLDEFDQHWHDEASRKSSVLDDPDDGSDSQSTQADDEPAGS